MPTEHVKYSLPDFILGKIAQEQEQEIERHLESCPACREEFDRLSQAISLIRESGPSRTATAPFSGVLPRVRERLDQPLRNPLWSSPFGERIVLPLAAAAVVVLLIVLTPATNGPTAPANSLRAVLEQVPTTELADVFAEETVPAYASLRMNQELMESVVGEHFVKGGFVTDVVLTDSGYGDVSGGLFQGIISNLSDEDVDNLLKRLGERKFL